MPKFTSRRKYAAIFGGLVPIPAFASTRVTSGFMQALCGFAVGLLLTLAVFSLIGTKRQCSGSN